MKAPDLVTVALIAAAIYFLWTAARDLQRQPRSYYAAGTLGDTWL